MELKPQTNNKTADPFINGASTGWLRILDAALLFILASLVMLIEIRITLLWLDKSMDSHTAVWIHMSVVAFLGFWSAMLHRYGQSAQFPPFLTLFTAVLGPFGTAGTLITSGFFYPFKKSSTPFEKWYENLFPDFGNAEVKKINDQADHEKSSNSERDPVIPFIDVLHYGSTKQKQAMLVSLIKNHPGKFTGILRKGLEDTDGSVRVLAAKGMARIEQYYMDREMELKNLRRERKIAENEFSKSQILNNDEYIDSGILDKIRERDIRLRTIKASKMFLRKYPGDLDIRFIVGRMMLRGEQGQQATDWFEECIRKNFKSPEIFSCYFECLYRLGKFEKLREQSANYFEEIERFQNAFQPDVYEVIRYWSGSRIESQQEPNAEKDRVQAEPQVLTAVPKTKTG